MLSWIVESSWLLFWNFSLERGTIDCESRVVSFSAEFEVYLWRIT